MPAISAPIIGVSLSTRDGLVRRALVGDVADAGAGVGAQRSLHDGLLLPVHISRWSSKGHGKPRQKLAKPSISGFWSAARMMDHALNGKVRVDFGPVDGKQANAAALRGPLHLDWLDCALICLFLLGLYTNYTVQISAKVPFPSLPAGVAGLVLLWRRRDEIKPKAFAWFIGVVALYLISILCAPNIAFLPRRTNGLIQLTYSITIGYALFLTVTQGSRRQIAGLFLGFSLFIVVGRLLEGHAGFRPISDAVRGVLYKQGIYENDLRDMLFYGRRPARSSSRPNPRA